MTGMWRATQAQFVGRPDREPHDRLSVSSVWRRRECSPGTRSLFPVAPQTVYGTCRSIRKGTAGPRLSVTVECAPCEMARLQHYLLPSGLAKINLARTG